MTFLPRLAPLALIALTACAAPNKPPPSRAEPALYPGETAQMRALINQYAEVHEIPAALLHKVIQRESDYRANARNGPYWGLMQILPETAGQMGHRGPPSSLLDAETNLKYAGKYLKGAYLVANGDMDAAVMWYARGYYYAARDKCLLVATGLRDRELRC
ncbi:transglycosylase SLT domain-containing protein [Alphaproteobacteria bacterium KMM 3653]|uniref:Transglycosylase SLT domain-containing protein n=1 Tax=Harenicola maris TaxID=2841044 RepID=A0AAP2CLJ8_9RHOB|nr:transglycosylase SLT domain-containing protein [Harenicola maris]